MSEVVHLESRRKPTRYSVQIAHYANGKVTVFLDGIMESERTRKQVSEVLRHAADMLIDNESSP